MKTIPALALFVLATPLAFGQGLYIVAAITRKPLFRDNALPVAKAQGWVTP